LKTEKIGVKLNTRIMFALVFIFFLSQFSNSVQAIDVSSCQTLSTTGGYYTLTADITDDDGTCFTIAASGITLDCQGHTIDGDADASGYGVIINGASYDNLTLKNCTIQEFARNLYVGANSDIIRIENSNLIHGYYDGAWTYAVDQMTIINSTFSGTNEYGFYAYCSGTTYNTNWTVINSNFTGGTTSSDYGIRILYLYNSTFINNTFKGISASGDRGASFEGESGNINFTNNKFESSGHIAAYFNHIEDSYFNSNTFSTPTSWGLELVQYSINNKLIQNNISSKYGLYFATYSSNNNITNNTISASGSYGIRINNYATGNSFYHNNITSYSYALYESSYSQNNRFFYNTIHSTDAYAIYLYDHSGGNTFYLNDIKSLATTNQYGIRAYYTSGNNNITNNNISSRYTALRLEYDADNNYIDSNNITSTAEIGVYLLSTTGDNNTIINNHISGGTHGLYIANNNQDNRIINNTIQANNGYGLYIRTGSNALVENNTILSGSSNDNGLGLSADTNITIRNNLINGTASGMIISGSSQQIYVINNTLNGALGGGNYYGLYLAGGSTQNTITNNSINSFDYRGIYMDDVQNNILSGNTITAGSYSNWDTDAGIYLSYSHYNNFTNNLVSHSGGSNVVAYYSNNNTFTGNTFNNGYSGIYCYYCIMRQEDFKNNIINNTSSAYDYRIWSTTTVHSKLYFLNTTYDENAFYWNTYSSLERLWYATVNVSNTDGQIENATVIVYDNTDSLVANKTTDPSGLTEPIPLREYAATYIGYTSMSKIYYSNYTFNISAEDHFSNTATANMSTNRIIYVSLEDWPMITILAGYPETGSYKANEILRIRVNESKRPDLITSTNLTITFYNGSKITFQMSNGTDGNSDLWEYNYTINVSDVGGPFNITALAYDDSGYNYDNDTATGFTITPTIVWFKTYDSYNKLKSFFAENENAKLKAKVYNPYPGYPKISLNDSSTPTIFEDSSMQQEQPTIYVLNYSLNGSSGFFNTIIKSNENTSETFSYSFYEGDNWNNKFTDSSGDI